MTHNQLTFVWVHGMEAANIKDLAMKCVAVSRGVHVRFVLILAGAGN